MGVTRNLDYEKYPKKFRVNHETLLAVIEFVENNESLLSLLKDFDSQEEELSQSILSMSLTILTQSDEIVETDRNSRISQEKSYISNFFDNCDRGIFEFLSREDSGSFHDDDINQVINKRISVIEAMMKTETKTGKSDLLCGFMGFIGFIRDILWCSTYKNVTFENHKIFDRLKAFGYRAAECYKTDASLWITLVKVELKQEQSDKAREALNKALNYVPDSEWLWICHIEMYMHENGDDASLQEVLDGTLIFFADNSFEIKPFEWIKAAVREMKEKISSEKNISEVLTSLRGIVGNNEIDKCSEDYEILKFLYLIVRLEAIPTNRKIWVRALFHKSINEYFLVYLFKIACTKCPNDVSLRNLIQAKKRWHNKFYASAQRLFNIVNEDAKWKYLIADKYSQFQGEMKEWRSYRHEVFKEIIELDPSDEDEVRRSYSLYWRRLPEDLKDKWLLGEHEFVQEVLAKAVLVYLDKKEFWLIKVKIEIQLGVLDQAAETFEIAIKSVNSCDAIDFYLKFAELEERRGNLLLAEKVLELEILRAEKDLHKVPLWIARIRLKLRITEKTEAQTLLAQAIEKYPKSGELWAEAIFMRERPKRGKKAAEALKICQDDKKEVRYVMLATAKHFFSRGNVNKSRKWFEKTVELDPHFGDAWIYYYKLEKIWGTEERARKVLIRCIKNTFEHDEDSVHGVQMYGEKWYTFKDRIDNWGLTDEELLEASVMKENIDVSDI